jgi:hypothetical protein
MKKLLFLKGLAFTLSSNAQLTQANNAPAPGDTYSMAVTSPSVLSPGASGAGAVWTYTNITLGTTTGFSSAAYSAASYSPSNVLLTNTSSESFYYESTSNYLKSFGGNVIFNTGLGAVPGTITYSAGAFEAVYPMSLSTSSTSAVGGSIVALSNNGTFVGSASTLADATGTLVLPGRTYTNVIRVRLTQSYTVSSALVNGPVDNVVYKYFAAGKKNPVLVISTSTTNLGSPSTQTTVSVDANYLATGINNVNGSSSEVIAYPNPANNQLNIVAAEATSLVISDITGKTILSTNVNNGKSAINTENFVNGVYFYTLYNNNTKLGVGKFTVTH